MMEHALFVSNPENLKFYEQGKFGRLYFGNEFCEHLIPTEGQLKYIVEWCEEKLLNLSFVTPAFLRDENIRMLSGLLEILPKGTEVIFNDYGLLDIINSNDHVPIQGRVLSIITRDPRTIRNKNNFEYMRLNNLTPVYQREMMHRGIMRIELDNVRQGYVFRAIEGIRTSLYYPFVYCNITRNCVFYDKQEGKHKCESEPLEGSLEGAKIGIKGNVQYYKNSKRPETEGWNLDRLIYMPVFPNDNREIRE